MTSPLLFPALFHQFRVPPIRAEPGLIGLVRRPASAGCPAVLDPGPARALSEDMSWMTEVLHQRVVGRKRAAVAVDDRVRTVGVAGHLRDVTRWVTVSPVVRSQEDPRLGDFRRLR